ncbi:MAG TPA: M48 family metalloprotease [Actinocrinis sp.]|nr:M48 family metalloprotease [Actinocrinis sp.]
MQIGGANPGSGALARPRAKRYAVRPDGTALWSLALVVVFLPVAALCLLPAFLPLSYLLGVPLWACYATWAATVLCYGLRPVQLVMARLLWPLRRPTPAERSRLDRVWARVLANAALPRRRFRIRVVDLAEVNAHSVGRDLICVTSGALARLGDRELAGVLAHELGHHLRMHTAASAFLVWVLLPLQVVALLGALATVPLAAAGRWFLGWAMVRDCDGVAGRRAAAAYRALAGALDLSSRVVRTVCAAPGAAAFAAKNAAGRRAEYQVDAFAVEVGLGGELLSALRWFAAADPGPADAYAPVTAVVPGPRAGAPAEPVADAALPRPTHPPLEQRMARIAAQVNKAAWRAGTDPAAPPPAD